MGNCLSSQRSGTGAGDEAGAGASDNLSLLNDSGDRSSLPGEAPPPPPQQPQPPPPPPPHRVSTVPDRRGWEPELGHLPPPAPQRGKKGNPEYLRRLPERLGGTLTRGREPIPVYHPSPSQSRLATQLTEEEQIRIAQRIGLIQHLPKGIYDPGSEGSEKKMKECVICMLDFVYGDAIRFLPCLHTYHVQCIDDWLMRSLTCPSCMEPVDAALLSSYETS